MSMSHGELGNPLKVTGHIVNASLEHYSDFIITYIGFPKLYCVLGY